MAVLRVLYHLLFFCLFAIPNQELVHFEYPTKTVFKINGNDAPRQISYRLSEVYSLAALDILSLLYNLLSIGHLVDRKRNVVTFSNKIATVRLEYAEISNVNTSHVKTQRFHTILQKFAYCSIKSK